MNRSFLLLLALLATIPLGRALLAEPASTAQEADAPSAPAEGNEPTTEADFSAHHYDGFTGYARQVTTESEEAQAWFDQGIQLLYGFNHDEAIRSFAKAAEVDPTCAMAWWGEAYARGLHINNAEMGEEQSQLARQAADKALAALDDETPVEQALIRAIDARYADPVPEDRTPLDEAYAEAMEAVWHQFPNDPDIGALYAESLMNLQPWDLWTGAGAPKGRTLEIVAVLEHTMRVAPLHPGANHFYIHAIEASPWPERGLPAAERLKDLVPGSGHLVHMPSHIYIRTGKYIEAAAANERAIAADEAYFALAPPPDFYSLYFVHNIHFLAYAAMMEGRYETALAAARKIDDTIPAAFLENYVTLADGFTTTTLHVLIRFGKWEEILAEPEPEDWRLFSRAERHYARAIALANLKRIDEAQVELEQMQIVGQQMDENWAMGNNPAEEVLAVAYNMAAGEIAWHDNRKDEAYVFLQQAVQLEEDLTYDEPPGWMQPVRHALGALYLADGLDEEAEEVYRADLVLHPGNAWSLLGLQQALLSQDRTEEAEELEPLVTAAWSQADVKPVASCYCHPDATQETEE